MITGTTRQTELPDELESPNAKLVYLYLSWHGEASVGELQAGLGMKKLSLYGVLQTLCERRLVEQNGEQYAAN